MALTTRSLPIVLLLASLQACGGSLDVEADPEEHLEPSPSVPGRPDVVVITLDTLRADNLSIYGFPRQTSPRLEELAQESLVFERCLAPVATTLPTHTSLFTGLWPLEHGVVSNMKGKGRRYEPPPGMLRLAEGFLEAGYRTAAFVSALPLKKRFGLEPGFESYEQPQQAKRPGKLTTRYASSWLDELGEDERLFLWVHYFDPHGPYEPSAPFDSLFEADEELEAWLEPRRFDELAVRPTGQENELRPAMDAYNGEVAYTDAQVGALIDKLRELGRWKDTVLVVVGDHGEGLNQHGAPGHGLTWQEQLHVPFLLRLPGIPARRVPGLVSVVDVLPTLCAVLELDELGAVAEQASGRDVLAPDFLSEPLPAISSERQEEFQEPTFALTGERWKTILSESGRQLLFDLEQDPFELDDVAGEHPEVARRMRVALEGLLDDQRRRGREIDAGGTAELDDSDYEELRGLGYTGAEEQDG